MFNCSNNNIIILIFVLIFCFIYCIHKINNIERKLNNKVENFTTQDDINTAVKKIYLADVEAIRLLSNFAIQLSQGGFTIPGNLSISGHLNTTGNLSISGQLILKNDIITNNDIIMGSSLERKQGIIHYDGTSMYMAKITPDGNNWDWGNGLAFNTDTRSLNISNNITAGNTINANNIQIDSDLTVKNNIYANTKIIMGSSMVKKQGIIYYDGTSMHMTRISSDGNNWDYTKGLIYNADTETLTVKNIICHNILTNI